MKKLNRYSLLLLIVLTLPSFLWGKAKIISNKVPLELRTLVETLDKSRLRPEQRLQFYQALKKIDLHLENIPREYVLLLSKAEIYKFMLEIKFNQAISYQSFTEENILKAKSKLSEKALSYSPFLWWVLSALIKDMEDLLGDPLFKNRLKNPNQEAENRLKILAPWLAQINNLSPGDFQATLTPQLIETVERMEIYLRAMILTTEFGKKKAQAGKNIQVELAKARPVKKTKEDKAKEVEIIEEALQEKTQEKMQKKEDPSTATPDWTPTGDSE